MSDRLRQTLGLSLAFLPGTVFVFGLWSLKANDMVSWNFPNIPWELWGIGFTGTAALIAAVGDWYFHTKNSVSPVEERGEVVALAGGSLMFILMAVASLVKNPTPFLIPIIIDLLFTVTFICHDEFVFHRRRCGAYENFLHKVIIFGNGIAWLSWFHWIFVRVRIPF